MEETRVHALDYLSVVRRRKRWLIVPIALSFVVGLALVRFLPKEYKSSATLGVSAPTVSPTLVSQAPTLDNEDRMRAISQQLLSPPLLARVAKEEGLVAGTSIEATVNKLRRHIEITVPDPVAQTNEIRRLDSFIVSYSDSEPDRAQRIANRITNVFVDENGRSRTSHAEETSGFIAAQLHASEQRLADLGAKLQKAKEAHMGMLPEQMQANLQTMNGLRQQLEANSTALHSEQDRLSMINGQIDQMKKGSAAILFVPHGNGSTTEVTAAPETRVMLLQKELAEKQLLYTDKHPEIQQLKQELADARKEAAADRQKPAEERAQQLNFDPAYKQLMLDRESTNLRIRDLQRSYNDISRQIGQYTVRVERAPMVEQQLSSVNRDFELEKKAYEDLSSRLHAATIAESVERNRRGEQFNVLYTASYPTEPTKPIPLRVMLISVLVGIVLGAALTLAREYLDRSVHDIRDLKDEFELPVLGEIARIQAA